MNLRPITLVLALGIGARAMAAHPMLAAPPPCHIQATIFDGWQAEELTNEWLRLTFVPELGGRLMQVTFNGHPYLFVNPKYKGKYISPDAAAGRWINYGGDKIWPLPEGNEDEQHWQGASTPLDDGIYKFKILSQNKRCVVSLEGPPDPPTGLQYTRVISIGTDSPEISFHAVMKNFTGHTIVWSVQSVSQYDLSNPKNASEYNHDFWAFSPVNPHSSYLDGYHVRDGLANDPSFSIKGELFRLNWRYLESEVWLDSTAGWIALIDGTSRYAMVEKTKYIESASYPGKASVIFYKNGPTVRLDPQGVPYLTSTHPAQTPYYMEAELNSPMEVLVPGGTYALDTSWFPSRMGRDLYAVTDAGMVGKPLSIVRNEGKLVIGGSFGVFFPGTLRAHLYDNGGVERSQITLQAVSPQDSVELHQTITAPADIGRISLHLVDDNSVDRGSLGEVFVAGDEGGR